MHRVHPQKHDKTPIPFNPLGHINLISQVIKSFIGHRLYIQYSSFTKYQMNKFNTFVYNIKLLKAIMNNIICAIIQNLHVLLKSTSQGDYFTED